MSQPIYDSRQKGFRVFIGNLGTRTNVSALQEECEHYGPLVDCWVARNPPGFAFILYKYGEDADSAVRNMNGRVICGQRVRVEHAKARAINPRSGSSHTDRRDHESRRRHSRDRRSRSHSSSSSSSRRRSKKRSLRRKRKHRSSSSEHRDRSRSNDVGDSRSSDSDDRRSSRREKKKSNDKKKRKHFKHRSSSSSTDDDEREKRNSTPAETNEKPKLIENETNENIVDT